MSSRTLASLTSIGRLMPASTSTLGRPITEIARFDGVPPNMSVRMATPSPVSTRFDRLDDVLAALLDVVVGADGDGLDLALRPDDMLQRGAKLDGEPPVGDKNKTDHRLEAPGGRGCAARMGGNHHHPKPEFKGSEPDSSALLHCSKRPTAGGSSGIGRHAGI